ncbi:MAG: hypothetical protein N3G75_07890, partial [Methanothrix sp.]
MDRAAPFELLDLANENAEFCIRTNNPTTIMRRNARPPDSHIITAAQKRISKLNSSSFRRGETEMWRTMLLSLEDNCA